MTTATFTFTIEDLEAARYAETIDAYLAGQLGSKGTTVDAIWSLEAEFSPAFKMFDRGDENDIVYGFADAKRRGLLPAYRERFRQEIAVPALAKYQRGKEVLKTAKIVASARTTLESQRLIDDLAAAHELLSPVVLVAAGHIATTAAARYIALARRKA